MFFLASPLLASDIAADMAKELAIPKKTLALEQDYNPAEFSNAIAGNRAWDVNRILKKLWIAKAFHKALGAAIAKEEAAADMASTEELLDRIQALINRVRPSMVKAETRAGKREVA